ncbi:hypothetical protein K802_02074, partial [Salmonella enterica subsp. enterica serovar Newport str. SHSN012]
FFFFFFFNDFFQQIQSSQCARCVK